MIKACDFSRLLQMHWNKIIPVVFFGIFLVSQIVTSPIYAQEKVYDVIIVGGGIAGLSAGQKLTDAHYDVLILEAREVGGRIVTDTSNGYPLDYGASWIHDYDAEDNPIRDLAEQHKDIQAVYTTYGSNATYGSSGELIEHGKERHIAMQKMWEKFEQKMMMECDLRQKSYEELTAEYDFSVEKVVNKIIDENELKGTDKEDFLFYVNWFIEQDNGADAKDISFWTWFEANEDESAPDCKNLIFHHEVKERIVLGYEQIVDILKEDLKIKTKTTVTKIDYTNTPVKVFTSDGSTYLAKRVISTVPLGVLKSSIDGSQDTGDIEFVPKLPEDKRNAIKNLEMGLLNKSFFIFSKDNVLWERVPAVDWILHVPGKGEEGKWAIFINMHHISNGTIPILLGLNSGSAGKELEKDIESSLQGQDATNSVVQEEGIKALREMFGDDIDDPVLVKISTKLNNPFLRGSYLYMPVGGGNYHESLGGPVIPEGTSLYQAKLFFAGEATYTKGDWGTAHAAYITGENEANCIIFLDKGWQQEEKQMENCRIAPEYVVPESNALSTESNESDVWLNMDTATFIGIIIAVVTSAIGIFFQAKEQKRARHERNLSIVEGYSSQLTELKNKERTLKTKKDCETYAQNYLDLMDQIAYLCRKGRGIPKDVRDYFENDFAYALTIIWWLKENNLIKAESIEDFFYVPEQGFRKSDNEDRTKTRDVYISESYTKHTKNFDDKSFPWYDLICWCLDENDKKVITPFDDDQLPDAMYFYDQLHEEDIEGTLEVVKGYGEKLNELTKEESKLTSDLECELYAIEYLDTLDSIAYLLRKNVIPRGVDDYFENYFAYGLTMIRWLEKKNLGDKITIVPKKQKLSFKKWYETDDILVEREYPWPDLLNWCKKKKIEPYDDSQLPKKMTDVEAEK